MVKKNISIGSSLDDLLEETGDYTESNALAIKRVIAWEVQKKMEDERISKTDMAKRLATSRSSLDRLLDPENTSITLMTLDNAARAIGKTLQVQLLP